MPGFAHNFDQHILDGTDLGDYDFGSIMHYPRDAFSKNGEDTIVPKGDHAIGQRQGLSAGDIAGVKNVTLALPRLVGGSGVIETFPQPLSDAEQIQLRASAGVIRGALDELENNES